MSVYMKVMKESQNLSRSWLHSLSCSSISICSNIHVIQIEFSKSLSRIIRVMSWQMHQKSRQQLWILASLASLALSGPHTCARARCTYGIAMYAIRRQRCSSLLFAAWYTGYVAFHLAQHHDDHSRRVWKDHGSWMSGNRWDNDPYTNSDGEYI